MKSAGTREERRWSHAPLLVVGVAFGAGLLVGPHLPLTASICLALLALAGAWWWRQRIALATGCLLLAVLALGAARLAVDATVPPHHLARIVSDAPRIITLHGLIRSDPVEQPAAFEASTTTFVVNTTAWRDDTRWQPTTGLVRVTVPTPTSPLHHGDAVVVQGWLQQPPSPGNPGAFDYRAYLARQRVVATLRSRPHDGLVVVRPASGWQPQSLAYRWRRHAQTVLAATLPPAEAGVLAALVLGARQAIPPALEEAFIRTGTFHVVAISGFNVGVLALGLMTLLRWLWVPRRGRLALTALALLLFMLMVDSRPPVVRATVMAWIVLGGLWLHRLSALPNALGLAALAALAWNPRQWSDPGFQLSFAAVIAIVTLTPRIEAACAQTTAGRWLAARRWGAALLTSLAASVAAWLGTAPLILHHFGVVSLIAVPANLLIVPLASALFVGGLLLIGLGAIWQSAAVLAGWGITVVARAMAQLVIWCGRVPYGGWFVAPWPVWGMLALYAGGLLWMLRRTLRWPEARVVIVWLVALNAWWWTLALAPTPRQLRLTALDVGHGDALVVEFPQRGRLLIDGGHGAPRDQGRWAIVPYLRARGIHRLDAVVLTHPDSDHVGGLATVVRAVNVGRVISAGDTAPTPAFTAFREALQERRVPQQHAQRGDHITGFPDVTIDVLHPSADDRLSRNDRSLVLRLRHGDLTLLLCGDLDEPGVAALLAREPALRADALKVPHHGSDLGQQGAALFTRLQPQVAVISMSAWSQRRLPHPTTVAALRDSGAQVWLTGRDGAVTVESDGQHLRTRGYRVHQ